MNRIVLLGGGGHARVLIDMLKASRAYEIIGILDAQLEVRSSVADVLVIGSDKLLPELFGQGVRNACVAVGSLGDNRKREALYKALKREGFQIPSLIHPRSIIAGDAHIPEGAQVMAGAIIQSSVVLGENSIINTGAIIDHDSVIGKSIHVCPGATVSGGCVIGDGTFIGAGATVIQGIRIGENVIVGAGAVVVDNIPDNAIVKGVPAR